MDGSGIKIRIRIRTTTYSIYSSATDIKFPGIAGNRQQFKFSTAVSAPAVLQPQSNLNLIHQPRKSQGYCKSK